MALLVPNISEILLLKYMLNHTSATDVVYHLYSGNVTPSETDVLGTYSTSEASDSLYTAATLPGASWTISTVGGLATAVHSNQSFSFSTSATLYGLYVTDSTSANLLWAERFNPGPLIISSQGGVITITPKISLD